MALLHSERLLRTVVNDSSVIAQYLEERYPYPSILPPTSAARAKARWLEEYADTRLGDVFVWKAFGGMVIASGLFGAARDLEAHKKLLDTDVVEVMEYLESVAPAEGFFCGPFGLADISLAAMFLTMMYARWTPDAARWPKVAGWLARSEAHPAMKVTAEWSDALIKCRPEEQRQKAIDLGLKVTATTRFSGKARRGPMTQISAVP